MDAKRRPVGSHRISRLAEKMRDKKEYRDSYVSSQTRQFLARQMREFRGDNSQTEFGEKIDKQQTVVSRLEDPNYGKWTLQTLFDVASKLDVAVLVKFVDFTTFLRESGKRTPDALHPKPYDQREMDDLAEQAEADGHNSALDAFNDSAEKILRGQDRPANENSAERGAPPPLPPQQELRVS